MSTAMRPSPLDLVREDLRAFAGYSSARRSGVAGAVWLNANESPSANAADGRYGSNRYPDPQPPMLRKALADLYGARPEQVLVGRGSDEAIDLLVRALCRPGIDAVACAPPVFGMYAVCARLQGAPLVEVPLLEDGSGFTTDLTAMAEAALGQCAKLVFLCSPANPTGQSLGLDAIAALARRLEGHAIVVVDEAYGEYASVPSAVGLIDSLPNVAVLRTLSKAHALAGARVGCLVADERLIELLRNCQAPYPLPSPCVDLALAALAPKMLARTRERVEETIAERERLYRMLQGLDRVRRVYPSQGNFLLVRFDDAEGVYRGLLDHGVVVRDMRSAPGLEDALRISIGSTQDNAALLAALEATGEVSK